MTQIVIDIPASLGTLVPTLPTLPDWTAVQAFASEGMLMWLVITAVVIAALPIAFVVGAVQATNRLPPPPPYYRGPGFFQWLKESRTQH